MQDVQPVTPEVRVELQGSVVIATWPEYPTVATVERFFDRIEGHLARRKPYATVLDARAIRSAPSEVRAAGGRRLKKLDPMLRLYQKGQATILSSALVRGALAAVYLISPPGYPVKVFSDFDSAMQWARAQL